VQVLVSGQVGAIRVKISSGSSVLDEAAVRAVTRWTFEPATRGARAVESWVEVPVTFNRR
jgi:periplasmic protein TonB